MAEQVLTPEVSTVEEAPKKRTKKEEGVYWSVGRRKTAIARIKMAQGKGDITINDRPLDAYFPESLVRAKVLAPLAAVERQETFDVTVKVVGGGKMSQAEAVAHGLARALLQYEVTLRPALKKDHFLTRDSRMKERKKYGLKRARKAPQFSKR